MTGLEQPSSMPVQGLEVEARSGGLQNFYHNNNLPESLKPDSQIARAEPAGDHTAYTAPQARWPKLNGAWMIVIIALGWILAIIAVGVAGFLAVKRLHDLNQAYVQSKMNGDNPGFMTIPHTTSYMSSQSEHQLSSPKQRKSDSRQPNLECQLHLRPNNSLFLAWSILQHQYHHRIHFFNTLQNAIFRPRSHDRLCWSIRGLHIRVR